MVGDADKSGPPRPEEIAAPSSGRGIDSTKDRLLMSVHPKLIRRYPLVGHFDAPSSKPETQRALVIGALAEGTTVIRRPLIARETEAMIGACRALGARVEHVGDELRIDGGAALPTTVEQTRYVWSAGAALVARLFATIGSALPERFVIDGTCVLRSRPFATLFSALQEKGLRFEFPERDGRLPCIALSRGLPGGRYALRTSVSSQFVTALLIPAPLARRGTVITLEGPRYSLCYIRQTIDMMQRFGMPVDVDDDIREIRVPGGSSYNGRVIEIGGDYTSASYLLGAAFVSRGKITVGNLDPESLQGERAIIDIVETLGASVRWLPGRLGLAVDCTRLPSRVDADFDLQDCPNILPTVAALAATIPGRVRITGARLTQFHKSPRIDAMAAELAKAGVPVDVLYSADGNADGLEIRGSTAHAGGIAFSSHGDHRIFMSLVLFSLACGAPCTFLEPLDTNDSFPDFLEQLGLAAESMREIA
jgi:3-phosphoshikimate 1-carboxyvinyltransferase